MWYRNDFPFLAQKAQKVYGVEIVPQAIEDAKHNAKINEITNAEFFVGKAEEVLPEYYADYAKEHPGEHARADVIVVDPPRKRDVREAYWIRWFRWSQRGSYM